MQKTRSEKNQRLGHMLKDMKRVIVAFSGGVDSTVLLKRAHEELGDQVLAVVVASELFRQREFDDAVKLAEDLGVAVHKTEIKELNEPEIAANRPDSWYHSKKLLYSHLNKIAQELNYPYVLDGMIMDDMDDFRPGLKARTEAGVRSLLQETGFYKADVRALAKDLELPVWDKPASCSLASRIPYGTKLDQQKIDQINQAELFLETLGFEQVRVRYHDNMARIEVPADRVVDLMHHREKIQMKCTALGFTYVSVDLQGYRTGSMNETLPNSITNTAVETISV